MLPFTPECTARRALQIQQEVKNLLNCPSTLEYDAPTLRILMDGVTSRNKFLVVFLEHTLSRAEASWAEALIIRTWFLPQLFPDSGAIAIASHFVASASAA